MKNTLPMRLSWSGPHAWPGYERDGLSLLPSHSGVYLWTFAHQDGFLLYAAGQTGSLTERFRKHTSHYMSGDYTILDAAQAKNGIRFEIWHGWGWTTTKRAEYEQRRAELRDAARQQLAEFRIFVADVGPQKRTRERLEAAIMKRLYADGAPLPDRGMYLAPRRNNEEPISVLNACASTLYGLAEQLVI